MIVPMSKVVLVGPKSLAGQVIAALHGFGKIHLSAEETASSGTAPAGLTTQEQAVKKLLERIVQEIEGLLHLLDFRGHAQLPAAEPDWESILDSLAPEEEAIRALVKQRLELEDELSLIQSYRQAMETLAPLLSRLQKSTRIQTFGFTLKPGSQSVWETVKKDLRKLTQGRVEFHSQETEGRSLAALAVFHASEAEKVRGYFGRLGINELRLPSSMEQMPMAEAVDRLRERSRDIPRELAQIARKLSEISARLGPALAGYRSLARDILARLAVKQDTDQGRFTFIIPGYLPQADLPELERLVAGKFDGRVTVQVVGIDHHESKRTPVQLKNPGLIKPFEMMLGIFNPPQYGTVDPTPFIAFFFPIYFGFIVGDLGYGLAMLALALLARWRLGKNPVARSLTTIFAFCAVWTAVFGVVFGELFGDLGEHLHLIRPVSEKLNRLSPESIMTLFWVSVIAGSLQVAMGFAIMLSTGLRHRDRHHILEPLAFVLGITGVAGFAASWMFHAIPATFLLPSVAMFLVGAAMLGWLAGIAGPIEIFGAVGNILSFARLFAIGLSAAYLAYAANLIGRTIGGVVGILVAALVIHPLFFTLGLISPIMQPFRLQVVEFFTKFKYHDYPGKKYQPFKTIGGTP
jgi:V/A-type H+-transporting ATPase subunit I